MPLTPTQKAALNIFSRNQVDLTTADQSGSHRSTLTGDESSISLGDTLDEFQDGAAYSTANITLAVATTGSDSSTVRPDLIAGGDFSAYPFLTIQAAIDSLPKNLKHKVTIDVGVGNFAGAVLEGFTGSEVYDPTTKIPLRGSIIIRGTTSLATLTTGPNTGFSAAGGSNNTITSITQNVMPLASADIPWTVNDLKNKWVRLIAGVSSTGDPSSVSVVGNGGQTPLMPIVSNAASFLTATGFPATPTTTTQYQIVTLATVINANASVTYQIPGIDSAAAQTPPFAVLNCSCDITLYALKFDYSLFANLLIGSCQSRVHVNSCDFRGATSKFGLTALTCNEIHIKFCQFLSNMSFSIQGCKRGYAEYNYIEDNRGPVTGFDTWLIIWTNNICYLPTAGAYSLSRVYAVLVQGSNFYFGGTGNGYALSCVTRVTASTGAGSGISGYGLSLTEWTGRIQWNSSPTGTTGDILLDGLALTHAQKVTNVKVTNNYCNIQNA